MRTLRSILFLISLGIASLADAQISEAGPVPITDPELAARYAAVVPPGTRLLMLPGALSSTRVLAPGDSEFARNQWGTADFSSTTYTGESFQPVLNSTVRKSPGYLEFTGAGGPFPAASAAIQVDSGVLVDGVMWWAFDIDATNNLTLGVYSLCWPFGPGAPVFTLHASGNTSGNAGAQWMFTGIGPPITIQNNLCSYYIELSVPAGSPDIVFERARVGWLRQVGPAPAMATFGDVPTGHQQFRFVEALAAAGITAGCGGGNFCPDQPLTRGQMAVFLSVALGLHFPF